MRSNSSDSANGPTSLVNSTEPTSVWDEARQRSLPDVSATDKPDHVENDQAFTESQFNRISKQVLQLYKPIEMLRSAITNSLLLFRMALGLTQDATMISCFEVLRDSTDRRSTMELINTADGPHKLSVPTNVWNELPDNIQAGIKHFNSMLSSCHKFIGSRELKLVDIQLKLDDLQLLPLSEEKSEEYQKLRVIPVKIDEFTCEIESLFTDITRAGKLLEYQVHINGTSTYNTPAGVQ